MSVRSAEQPRFNGWHGESNDGFQFWSARDRAQLENNFIPDASQLAEATTRLELAGQFVAGLMNDCSVGIHHKDQTFGIPVIMQLLENGWKNASHGRPAAFAKSNV